MKKIVSNFLVLSILRKMTLKIESVCLFNANPNVSHYNINNIQLKFIVFAMDFF